MEIQPAQCCGVERHAAPQSVCRKIASKWFHIITSYFSPEVAAIPDRLGVSVIAIETLSSTTGQTRRAQGWNGTCRLFLTDSRNNIMQNWSKGVGLEAARNIPLSPDTCGPQELWVAMLLPVDGVLCSVYTLVKYIAGKLRHWKFLYVLFFSWFQLCLTTVPTTAL